jgi:2-oxoglutarate dehydrogenase E2 component (dihydrolipoamide succinyltransferase)
MPVDIVVPSVGESITEGTLSRWLKKDGDFVRAEEPLFELETEKATTEVAAQANGILHTTVREGDTVKIGAVVGRIEEGAEPPAGKRTAPVAEKQKPSEAPSPARNEIALSPAARRLAEAEHVNVHQLQGTGRDGRVTKEDVQAQVEARKQPPAPVPGAPPPRRVETAPVEERPAQPATPAALARPRPPEESRETRQRMSSIRQRISERLVQSQQTTATLTTFNEADMSAVLALRERYKDRFKEKHGVGLGFMGFFVKAVVEALKGHPLVSSRIEGNEIVTPHYHDIGVAVSTERGLMVPVVRDAGRKSFAEIEKEIASLAARARDGKIAVADLQGGTFTITNGGVFGSLLSTPILNPPQSAILGMHTIQKRPIAVNDQVVIRPMMYLALSYDHRLIDGREAVLFLVRVKECVENPERLMLEV